MTIYRRADQSETKTIAELLRAGGLRSEGVLEPSTRYWVAEASGRVIGAIGLELGATDVLLRSAIVDPGSRCQGIGRALTREALSWARSNGYTAAYCFSTDAGTYWIKAGFRPCPVAEVLCQLDGAPQVRLFKTLGWLSTEAAYKFSLQGEKDERAASAT